MIILRWLLGLIFGLQGYGKVFTFGINNVYQKYFLVQFEDSFLPTSILKITAYYTSYAELICGSLLLIGWKVRYNLYILGSVLLIVSFGHGVIDPIWDLQHVLYRAMLLIPLLFLPRKWDRFSTDFLVARKSTQKKRPDSPVGESGLE